MKQKIKIDPLEYKLVSILFFLLMLLFLFTACNKEEPIQQPECKNCTVVHEDNVLPYAPLAIRIYKFQITDKL
jgi:hypothetical protein